LRSTDTVFESKFALTRSLSPSPSRSALVIERGCKPTPDCTWMGKVPLPWLRSTDTVFELMFALARSWSPSPSRSALVTEIGNAPTPNAWLASKHTCA